MLQLLVINEQIAEYFQHGFTDDQILVLLAESCGILQKYLTQEQTLTQKE